MRVKNRKHPRAESIQPLPSTTDTPPVCIDFHDPIDEIVIDVEIENKWGIGSGRIRGRIISRPLG